MDSQQEPIILLKGKEVQQFEQMLDTIPHGYVKKIVQFINICQSKRQLEKASNEKKINTDESKISLPLSM